MHAAKRHTEAIHSSLFTIHLICQARLRAWKQGTFANHERKLLPAGAPAAGDSLASRWDCGRAEVCRPGTIMDLAACIGVRQLPQAMSTSRSPQRRLRRAVLWRPAGIGGVQGMPPRHDSGFGCVCESKAFLQAKSANCSPQGRQRLKKPSRTWCRGGF